MTLPTGWTWVNYDDSDAASNAVIAAATGYRIAVMGLALVAAGAVTVTIEDSAGVNLIGPMALPANGGIVLPPTGMPYIITDSDKGLSILHSGAVQVGGVVIYEKIPNAGA